MRPKRATDANRGFTLLELILAITIMGTIILIALGALRMGQRSWEKGDAVAENNQRLRIAAERIRQQLSEATVYIGPGEDAAVIGFAGQADEIRFASRLSLIPGREQGIVFVHYRVFDTPDQGRVLGFYERPVVMLDRMPDIAPGPEAYHRLIVGLGDASWAYRGTGEAIGGGWQRIWDAGEQLALPDAVRFSFQPGADSPLSIVIRVVNPAGD